MASLANLQTLHANYLALLTIPKPLDYSLAEYITDTKKRLESTKHVTSLDILMWKEKTFGTCFVKIKRIAKWVSKNCADILEYMLPKCRCLYLDLNLILDYLLDMDKTPPHNEALRVLFAYPGLIVNNVDTRGLTPLMRLCHFSCLDDFVKRADVDVNANVGPSDRYPLLIYMCKSFECLRRSETNNAFATAAAKSRPDIVNTAASLLMTGSIKVLDWSAIIRKLEILAGLISDINQAPRPMLLWLAQKLIQHYTSRETFADGAVYDVFQVLLNRPDIDVSIKDEEENKTAYDYILRLSQVYRYYRLFWRHFLCVRPLPGAARHVFVAGLVQDPKWSDEDLRYLASACLHVPDAVVAAWPPGAARAELRAIGAEWDATSYEAERARRPEKRRRAAEYVQKLVEGITQTELGAHFDDQTTLGEIRQLAAAPED